tara:strand:+ start:29 stop:253 length:225 start_codon:yes stop_codon:yes gene_type:complete
MLKNPYHLILQPTIRLEIKYLGEQKEELKTQIMIARAAVASVTPIRMHIGTYVQKDMVRVILKFPMLRMEKIVG